MRALPASLRAPGARKRGSSTLCLLASCSLTFVGGPGFAQAPNVQVTHSQVNVNALGQNIPGDAANEPSLCIDPLHPNRIAVGWRQFDSVSSDFRQAGWGYSTNGGLSWTFPGVLERGIFRSDPVLASDAEGTFYYLGVLTNTVYHCDMFKSTDGGATWQFVGLAEGGDKEWMAIDTTTGPGRGNIYQAWSPFYNFVNNVDSIFTGSTDGGATWAPPSTIPNRPFWGTVAVGPAGEVYMGGWDGSHFWVSRSTNAMDATVATTFDVVRQVDLGGAMVYGATGVNPDGLLGQPWVAVDNSTGKLRGNLYLLCTVAASGPASVMFARSTDGGLTWSAPVRVNDDPTNTTAYHWFGTLSVAPNGRLDACWNDTRNDPTHTFSELYSSSSQDGGVTWATNIAVSSPFNHTLGYPMQRKMGDYLGMISINAGALVAHSATFNGEEDIWFTRVELPAAPRLAVSGETLTLTWDTFPNRTYCVQAVESLQTSWATAATLGCLEGTGQAVMLQDTITNKVQRFYRVVSQP